jgi:hypothetical protein
MLPMSIVLCLVSNVTRVYLSVSCAQCYPCLSFCVFCPMLHVSIFLCLVPNRVTLGTRHRKIHTCNIGHKTQKDRHGNIGNKTQNDRHGTCLSVCVLCSLLHVFIFLCLVPHVTRVYLSVSCVQCYTCLSVCNTGSNGHKTQKDRHG